MSKFKDDQTMSLSFKFDKYAAKPEAPAPDQPRAESETDIELYEIPSHNRFVCFIQPDGKSLSLNYAYLVSVEFLPEVSEIAAGFTTHKIIVKGNNLKSVFNNLNNHQVKTLTVTDKRYISIKDSESANILEITTEVNR